MKFPSSSGLLSESGLWSYRFIAGAFSTVSRGDTHGSRVPSLTSLL